MADDAKAKAAEVTKVDLKQALKAPNEVGPLAFCVVAELRRVPCRMLRGRTVRSVLRRCEVLRVAREEYGLAVRDVEPVQCCAGGVLWHPVAIALTTLSCRVQYGGVRPTIGGVRLQVECGVP